MAYLLIKLFNATRHFSKIVSVIFSSWIVIITYLQFLCSYNPSNYLSQCLSLIVFEVLSTCRLRFQERAFIRILRTCPFQNLSKLPNENSNTKIYKAEHFLLHMKIKLQFVTITTHMQLLNMYSKKLFKFCWFSVYCQSQDIISNFLRLGVGIFHAFV